MTIRSATSSDLNQLTDLVKAYGGNIQPGLPERIATCIADKAQAIFVAEDQNQLIGYAWVQNYGPHLRSGESTAKLHDLFVLPGASGQGTGTQLFQAVSNWAKSSGIKYLQWQAGTNATEFYRKQGLEGDTQSDLVEHPFYEVEF